MSRDFDKVLRKLEYGVYIITTGQGNDGNAFTGSWVTQVSGDPPLVAIAVHNKHQSNPMLKKHGAFVVHLIGEGQMSVAKTYYGPAESGYRKLESAAVTDSPATGTAVLGGSVGYLDCAITSTVPAGNHTVFIGEVKAAQLNLDDRILTRSNSNLVYTG